MFGVGLIDAISADELRAMEKLQAERGGDISGRVAPARPATRDPLPAADDFVGQQLEEVGRFGWRGQTATLADFVLGACANELGLSNAIHGQAADPLSAGRNPEPTGEQKRDVIDLDQEQCRALIDFVRKLPRPAQIKPTLVKLAAVAHRGEEVFRTIGCIECHVEKVGGVAGLFSDMLLHDMGSELSDPVPAMPKIEKVGERTVFSTYGGAIVTDVTAEVATEIRQEWRTPPLWGVADSPPYLHDGRAPTLSKAILLHGGEAAKSRQRFAALSSIDRDAIESFLMTLRAPRQNVADKRLGGVSAF